ncbi:MAG TPA: DUF6458 family protein [Acidothermaceae bacterium]|jgi:hypothetical protein|nr:DUF6458 family protein [Acidothermaceae bacterium]
MGIGVSVFLIAVGAILTFAVHAAVSGVSIPVVGVILMVAGAIGLLVTLTVFAPRRRTSITEERAVGEPVTRDRVIERHDVY